MTGFLEVEGRRLAVSNLDKVLWPAAGFTKGEMLDYYVRVAPALLRHLRSRPVTLRRFPEGVEEEGWYQNDCPAGGPSWVRRRRVVWPSGREWEFCAIDDLATLVWVGNLGTVELHPFFALRSARGADRRRLRPRPRPARGSRRLLPRRDPPARAPGRARARSSREGLGRPRPSRRRAAERSAHLGGGEVVRARARAAARRGAARRGRRPPAPLASRRQGARGLAPERPGALDRGALLASRVRLADCVGAGDVGEVERGGPLLFEPAAVLDRLERLGDVFAAALEGEQRL